MILLHAGLLAAVPAAALYGVARSRFLKALGAVVVCYCAGILIGNAGPAVDLGLAKNASTLCVALAIPLLLFATDVPGWLRSAESAVLSFTAACVAVAVAAWLGGSLFAARVPESREIAAMLAGVYTGGTPNMSALAVALDVRQETFLLVNGVDMILSTLYLLFMTTAGKRVLGTFLRPYAGGARGEEAAVPSDEFAALSLGGRGSNAAIALVLAALIAGASAGLSLLIIGRINETFVIFAITTFGVGGSFLPRLKKMAGTFHVGNYLLLIFCVAVGTMTRLGSLVEGGWAVPLLVLFVITASILLHYAAAVFLRIDAETVLITSCAAILSPPFVVIVAAALKNRDLLVAGITSGLIGYAIGNYVGLGVFRLL